MCSEYKYWGTLVAAVDPGARSAVAAEFSISEAGPLLVAALRDSSLPFAVAAWVKNKMLALDPSFDERNYGCRSFRDFLDGSPDLIDVVRAEGDVRVSMKADRREQTTVGSDGVDARSVAPSEIPPPLRLLRQRGMDLPMLPEARDALLTSVYEAWRDGRVSKVSDIADLLLDEETGYTPNARTRGALRHCLVLSGTPLIPLAPAPDDGLGPLGDRQVEPWSGRPCAEWVWAAHVAWLSAAAARLGDQDDLVELMVATFFAGARAYGAELIPAVMQLPPVSAR